MKIFIEKEDREVEVKSKIIRDILKELEINITTVMVVANGELVLEDYVVKEDDEVKIIPVISGG